MLFYLLLLKGFEGWGKKNNNLGLSFYNETLQELVRVGGVVFAHRGMPQPEHETSLCGSCWCLGTFQPGFSGKDCKEN